MLLVTQEQQRAASYMARIQKDMLALERLIHKASEPSPALHTKAPPLKVLYTPEEAHAEKQRIENLFASGLISFDKKRGMKISVTRATFGYSKK